MKNFPCWNERFTSTIIRVALSVSLATTSTVAATTDDWTGTTSAVWNTGTNWSGGSAPGSTDTALFNGAGSGSIYLTFSGSAAVENITFDTSSAAAYTIGTTGGPALTLTSGGTIQTTSTVAHVETINAPLIIGGTAASTYTFSSGSAVSGDVLNIGGSVTGAATSGTTLLTLGGTNTGANTVSGVIGDGSGGGTLGVTKSGAGTWILPARIRIPVPLQLPRVLCRLATGQPVPSATPVPSRLRIPRRPSPSMRRMD